MTPRCRKCGRLLHPDEVAITKKLVNRGAKEYCCTACLAVHFGVTQEDVEERIRYFKALGCTLFEENRRG